jgi:hypothetical protein
MASEAGKAQHQARSICECIHARWRNWDPQAIDRARHRKGPRRRALVRAHQQYPAGTPPRSRIKPQPPHRKSSLGTTVEASSVVAATIARRNPNGSQALRIFKF